MTRHRLAIAISSAVAACFLAAGLSAAGYGPLGHPDVEEAPSVSDEAVIVADVDADVARKPKVVYVKPAPKPKTVVVTQRSRASETASRPTVQRRVSSTRWDDDDDDHERDRRDHEDEDRDRDRDDDDERERERDDD